MYISVGEAIWIAETVSHVARGDLTADTDNVNVHGGYFLAKKFHLHVQLLIDFGGLISQLIAER